MELFTTEHGTSYLAAPLMRNEIEAMQSDGNCITARVLVNVDDMLEGGYDAFYEIVSEKITGTHRLQDPQFKPVDVVQDYGIVFEITGYVEDEDLDYLS